ncbi:hypothetical protein TBLA_0A03080 [Henningerozyma blattae CBS 6284]|uniref:Uncharacterized protein n=1 Tax=Henningerozyma blattae (strain ATCC 34711 / CBS 6284 / DSM 70876 / NBRC 10599 / NRRL Y-10934 / UCD 77-7) TaxID=1071380 RepID=I2GVF6_HENB6|nr:hypothetical protein TBLA_0A03080 [Tetrapisispora blattae CBS 6284]CCH58108.1 hypothetical protein TBLA_0A03080 [Tetrapisispora blattae CBS 6284]
MSDVISITKKSGSFQKFNWSDDIERSLNKSIYHKNDEMDIDSDEDEDEKDIDTLTSGATTSTNNSTFNNQQIVTPGELVTDDPMWMRGHGTYYLSNMTYSSVAGAVSKVNRLLSVLPLKARYSPETGDHIVGRITEVGNRRWKVDIGAKQHAVLMLGSVNLPGGILRRKSENDELQMRSFLKEGDLLNAEVQTLFQDGSASLHTRSLKYGKLRDGIFLRVPSSLIVRSKNHTHNLPGNVTVVLGVNGYIWLRKTSQMDLTNDSSSTNLNSSTASSTQGPTGSINTNSISITRLEEESSWRIYSDENDKNITNNLRKTISRYTNVIRALSMGEIGITKERIVTGYEASMAFPNIGSLIELNNMQTICEDVINAEKMRGNAI